MSYKPPTKKSRIQNAQNNRTKNSQSVSSTLSLDELPDEDFLNSYLDSFSTLPKSLKESFNAIRNLDERVQKKITEIDKETAKYLVHSENLTKNGANKQIDPDYQVEFRTNISNLFEQARTFSDDKINFANKSYDEVDRYIRMLDHDLPNFEKQLKDQAKKHGLNFDEIMEEDKRKQQNSSGGYKALQQLNIFPFLSGENGSSGYKEQEDIPIDPNEPTYCYCKQVSYGEMIACDNDFCDIEWFHLQCVGLDAPPKKNEKWYCTSCRPSFVKKPVHLSKSSGQSSSRRSRR